MEVVLFLSNRRWKGSKWQQKVAADEEEDDANRLWFIYWVASSLEKKQPSVSLLQPATTRCELESSWENAN